MSTNPTSKFTCRICKNEQNNTPYTAREMMYGLRETFQYFQCASCNCLQIAEFPENMEKYYPGDYYSLGQYDGKEFLGSKGAFKKKKYAYSVLGSSFFKNRFAKKAFQIFKDISVTKQSRILDVGCGNGYNFLYPLAEIGFQNLQGCDPYISETINYDNGLKIETNDAIGASGEWDLITYHHAFEHLPNPFENMKAIKKLLADDGVCVIRIPTTSSYAWEHYRTNWVQMDAPRHFFVHSKESMDILAEAEGMEVYQVVYDSIYFQFTGSEKYINDISLADSREKGFMASMKRKLEKRKYKRMSKKLNEEGRGDQAAFFIRKK